LSHIKDKSISEVQQLLRGKITNTEKLGSMQKELKGMKAIFTKSVPWIQKPFKLLGRILAVGKFNVPSLHKWYHPERMFKFAKAFGGGTARFIAVMMLMAPVTHLFIKASHKLFGKPSNSELNEKKKRSLLKILQIK
jgi:hypothetical protein